jgi:hypothetical protein
LIISRNLTDVENELSRVKAMLQQARRECDATRSVSPSSYRIPMPQASSGAPQQFDTNKSDTSMLFVDDMSRVAQQPLSSMAAPSVDALILSPVLAHEQAKANSVKVSSPVRPVVKKLINSHHIPSKGSLTQVELEPTQGLFEWDERTSDAGGDGSADGMAILPGERDIGGYLGKKPIQQNTRASLTWCRCHIRSRTVTPDGHTTHKRVSASHSYKPQYFASELYFYICSAGKLRGCIFPDVSRMLPIRYLTD